MPIFLKKVEKIVEKNS